MEDFIKKGKANNFLKFLTSFGNQMYSFYFVIISRSICQREF